METIRTLVVDDEKPARTRLLELLEKEQDIEIAGVGRDGREAVQLIRGNAPDLLFLDIQMPGLDGFGVLAEVGPEQMPVTVFVTAYDKYAIRAFEAHALDYLLKPFSDERFEAALERARLYIRTHRASELGEHLARLLAGQIVSEPGSGNLERLVIKSSGRVTFLEIDEIDWIEAAGVYVYLHAGPKTHLYRATIGQLQERLDPKRFVRVHRSAAVNTDRIRELHPRTHGDYTVVLKDGTELTLSRKYRPRLETWLRQSL
jgi:two-component system LytT family response regulator